MNRIIIHLFILSGLLLLYPGCKSQGKSTSSRPANSGDFSSAVLAESGNLFALDLFRQTQEGAGNMVFSPYSIHTVMGMVYTGAGGETAEQMGNVLYLPEAAMVNSAARELKDKILSSDTLEGTEISLANAIWMQENYEILPGFTEDLKRYYEAPVSRLDFTRDNTREAGRLQINNWVEENTGRRIRDLIGPDVLDANTRLILTNAIYFNGMWKWPFDKSMTLPSVFHVGPRESLQADFMHMTRRFMYYEDDEVQSLQLPYRDDRLSMTIILPRKVDGWMMVSRVLNNQRLETMESQFEPREVQVSIPRFKLELNMNLGKELSAMGMEKAFGKDADLSGINGEKDLFVDEVIHKAFIDVSESGTEAAAATGAVISLKSSLRDEPVRFNADHPFLFFIRDRQTACIIFIGRLVKPS